MYIKEEVVAMLLLAKRATVVQLFKGIVIHGQARGAHDPVLALGDDHVPWQEMLFQKVIVRVALSIVKDDTDGPDRGLRGGRGLSHRSLSLFLLPRNEMTSLGLIADLH